MDLSHRGKYTLSIKIDGPVLFYRWHVYLGNTIWKEGVAPTIEMARENAEEARSAAHKALTGRGYIVTML